MLIQKIKINNYKTYLSLDLDLTVDDDRPIILIGGANGGGKTTLFEAISGALYGLKIESKEHCNHSAYYRSPSDTPNPGRGFLSRISRRVI